MQLKKHYFLMISCPSDVIKERALLKECVETINNQRSDDSWVELNYWVTDTFSDAGTPAQESINKQIVEKSDGLIAIFNARLGTPVHNYPCGTAEEIDLMLKAGKHVSLLFNTHPQIDLTNTTSIDQITQLQKYKEEQSSKSFYKEFKDEESFKTTVSQEIRMWLRTLTSASPSSIKIDDGILGETPTNKGENSLTVKEDVPPIDKNDDVLEDEIDLEAGPLDCVIYITNSAADLTTSFNDYANLIQDFQVASENFVQKFNFLNKQSNQQGILVLCKKFASDIKEFSNNVELFSINFENKWGKIYTYLKMLPYEQINQDDKIILKSSISMLKGQFELAREQTLELIAEIDKMPNFQKNLNNAMRTLKVMFNKYYSVLDVAVNNCEELEGI